MLFLWYEEMKKDLGSVIRKTSSFLKKDFPEEKVTKLVDHLSFDNFKNNDAVNMKPPKGAVPDEVSLCRFKVFFHRPSTLSLFRLEKTSTLSVKERSEAGVSTLTATC